MQKDNYVLVTKEELKKLKENNEKFQQEIKTDKTQIQKIGNISDFTTEIISKIKEENQIERELIKKELVEIKELNKITIDNILSKSSIVEKNLISLTGTLKELVGEMRNSFEKDDNKILMEKIISKNTESIKQLLSDFMDVQKLKDMKGNEDKNEFLKKILVISSNLKDVDDFMNNLKILLSYLSPNEINNNNPNLENKEIKN